MKNGKYFSEKLNDYVWIYKEEFEDEFTECSCCGKRVKSYYSLQIDSDEQGIEYIYGSACIKNLKLRTTK